MKSVASGRRYVIVNRLTSSHAVSSETSFTARNGGDGRYSEGSTFWLGSKERPDCLLEQLALSTFESYTSGLRFDPELSGAEWWTLVMDMEDDVGM